MIDAVKADAQLKLIHALGELKTKTGQDVYFLHVRTNSYGCSEVKAEVPCSSYQTSGAKQFSEFADFRGPVSDNDPDLYDKQTIAKYTGGPAEFVRHSSKLLRMLLMNGLIEYRSLAFLADPCWSHKLSRH